MKSIQTTILLLLMVVGPLGMKLAQSEPVPPELPSRVEKGPQSTIPAASEDDIVLPESAAATELKAAEKIEREEATKGGAKTQADCVPALKEKAPAVQNVKLTDKGVAKVSCNCKPKIEVRIKKVPVPGPVRRVPGPERKVPVPGPERVVQVPGPERRVEVPTFHHHALTLLAGVGPDGFYTELEKDTRTNVKEYRLYKSRGFLWGAMYQYFFTEHLGIGAEYISNDAYLGAGTLRW